MKIPKPVIVFVNPQAEGNIGALSRVMANFSSTDLRLVGEGPQYKYDPQNPFSTMDWAMAKNGQSVLDAARWYPTLEAALEGTEMAFGTSGKLHEIESSYARPLYAPTQAFSVLKKHYENFLKQRSGAQEYQWALVFGREDDGLLSRDLACCNSWIRIDTSDECPSMNIVVAAACLLYHAQEYFSALSFADPPLEAFPAEHMTEAKLSRFEHKERLAAYVVDTLRPTAFFKYPDHEAVQARLRRVLQSVQIPLGELLFLFEIFYHLRCWGNKKFEDRNFLK